MYKRLEEVKNKSEIFSRKGLVISGGVIKIAAVVDGQISAFALRRRSTGGVCRLTGTIKATGESKNANPLCRKRGIRD